MKRTATAPFIPLLTALCLVLTACGEQSAPDRGTQPPAATPAAAKPVPDAPAPPKEKPPTDVTFAPAPALGLVAKATCHMGACTWNRFDEVVRSGTDAVPEYRLRITQGESQHPGDYPARPDGVVISWDAASKAAKVTCSIGAPYASVGDQSEMLKLNPQGVAGVSQALANLYFTTCHGEYGNDGELAGKYGYNVR